jgi:hypothetical protein
VVQFKKCAFSITITVTQMQCHTGDVLFIPPDNIPDYFQAILPIIYIKGFSEAAP